MGRNLKTKCAGCNREIRNDMLSKHYNSCIKRQMHTDREQCPLCDTRISKHNIRSHIKKKHPQQTNTPLKDLRKRLQIKQHGLNDQKFWDLSLFEKITNIAMINARGLYGKGGHIWSYVFWQQFQRACRVMLPGAGIRASGVITIFRKFTRFSWPLNMLVWKRNVDFQSLLKDPFMNCWLKTNEQPQQRTAVISRGQMLDEWGQFRQVFEFLTERNLIA